MMGHIPVDIALSPHEALAAAVIALALHDAKKPGPRGEHARRFLADSPGLRFWCHVANVPTSLVVQERRLSFATARQKGAVSGRKGSRPESAVRRAR